jgi:hypothetical protein
MRNSVRIVCVVVTSLFVAACTAQTDRAASEQLTSADVTPAAIAAPAAEVTPADETNGCVARGKVCCDEMFLATRTFSCMSERSCSDVLPGVWTRDIVDSVPFPFTGCE